MEDEEDIPGKIGDMIRLGRIASIDLASGLAVVHCGDIESPPCPWTELAGAFRTWCPPSEGEQVLLVCPEGDIAGGVILRGLFSGSFPAPASDADPQLHGPDGLIVKLTGDGIEITAPGNVRIDGDLTVTGTITGETDVIAAGISGRNHTHHTHPGTGGPQ